MAWDGTLSRAEFDRAALFLVSTWERCCPELPQWAWQTTFHGRACAYLALQDVRVISDRKDHVESHDEEDDADDHDVEDQATMVEGLGGDYEQHLYTYHVVYNESYRVPMLLLQGRLPDGRPLEWKSVLRDLPVGSQHISSESRWTFLTQEDHPLLNRPWFALHPCGTCEIMSLVFSKDAASSVESKEESADSGSKWMEKYILSWMSFACPAVGLVVPSRLFIDSK